MTDHIPERAPGEDENEFAERIARPLRAPEWLDVTFESRVMAAVQTDARAHSSAPPSPKRRGVLNWWVKPRELRVSPLRGLALAAALVAFTLLGSQGLRLWVASRQPAQASADTVHVVRFVLVDPDARAVSLVGDFNAWQKGATPLAASGRNGAWVISLPLQAGRHEYAFIVENGGGQRWVADPFASTVRDEFDTESSVIMVGNYSGTGSARRTSS